LAKKLDERFTPPLMDVNDLVDAALIGFDRKETITIPVLKDENHHKIFLLKSWVAVLVSFYNVGLHQPKKSLVVM
jgi:hypothetical protein